LVQRPPAPTLLLWHPVKKLLAIGWKNGEIAIWNEHNKELHDIPSLHTKSITTLCWSSNGNRIASGDEVINIKRRMSNRKLAIYFGSKVWLHTMTYRQIKLGCKYK